MILRDGVLQPRLALSDSAPSSESQIDETTELQHIGKPADHLREQRTRIQGLLQLSIVFGVAALVVAGLAFVVEKAFYVR